MSANDNGEMWGLVSVLPSLVDALKEILSYIQCFVSPNYIKEKNILEICTVLFACPPNPVIYDI